MRGRAAVRGQAAAAWLMRIHTMYKPYLSRQKSGKSVQTTVSAGDKTTLKLVTEQLRASQKVLNKSDQFIPAQWPGGGGAARSCPLRPPPAPRLGQWEGAVRVRWTNHSGAGLSCMASLCHTGHPPLGHAIEPSVPYHSTIVPLSTVHPPLAPHHSSSGATLPRV